MDKTRLNKVSRLVQKELGDYFQKNMRSVFEGTMITVTVVRITPDLSNAKVYISIFPSDRRESMTAIIAKKNKTIRYDLAQRTRHQLRKVPELQFFVDDSLDYADRIDDLLK